MTDLDQQVGLLLRAATDDLDVPRADLVDAGLARGRRTLRRRRAAASVTALAVAVVVGVGLSLGGEDVRTAVDPADSPSAAPSPSAAAPSAVPPDRPAVRGLAMKAAAIPGTFASLIPGEVALSGTKENPMDGFDARQRFEDDPDPSFEGEPGPGIIADFTSGGYFVRVAVAPTDPYFGETPLQRCRGGGEGGNGTCVAQSDGGVLQISGGTSPPTDGGATVRAVTYYTPDLWEVLVSSRNSAAGGDAPPIGELPFSVDQLTAVAESDVWFE